MNLDPEAAGKAIGPVVKPYGWRDVALYGLAVGAGFSDLEYCHEEHLKPLPTFAMAAVFDLFWQAAATADLDLGGVLHGEQELIFHRPIPPEGRLVTRGRIARLYDNGPDKGALIMVDTETRQEEGPPLFSGTATIFSRRDGGFGGPKAPSTALTFPDRPPDHRVGDRPAENQPLLYRLTGDLFALHADPGFARRAGFDRPIMHGLCTLGFACRALIGVLAPGRPDEVRRLRCRFSAPLYPGTPIETRIWRIEANLALWRVAIAETGQTIIDHGLIETGPPAAAAAGTGPAPSEPI